MALDWGERPRVFPGAAGSPAPVAEEEELKGLGRGNLVWVLVTVLSGEAVLQQLGIVTDAGDCGHL